MRILFLGDGAAGARSLDALALDDAIVGVVAHPTERGGPDAPDSVARFAEGAGLSVARFGRRDPGLARFVRDVRPDLIWIAGYRHLLPRAVLELAPLGAINLHPSLLPLYRGQSSLFWAILHGEREVGLTAHFADEGADSGDIVAQRRVALGAREDFGDAQAKLEPLYEELSREVARALRIGKARRTPQAPGHWPIWPLRKFEDGRIDWSADSESIANLVRAAARPLTGAFSWLESGRITIWKSRAGLQRGPGSIGAIWRSEGGRFAVNCGEGSLEVLEYELDGQRAPRVGDRLEPLDRAA